MLSLAEIEARFDRPTHHLVLSDGILQLLDKRC
jgi:hypothetical protein